MQSKKRLLELNARFAQNLTDKGVEATADETTTALIDKIADIPIPKEEQEKTVSISENGTYEVLPDEDKVFSKVEVNVNVSGETVFYNEYGKLYVENLIIPEGVTTLGNSAYEGCDFVTVILPSTLTKILSNAFNNTVATEIDFSKCQELELLASGALGNSKFATLDFSKNQMLKTLDNNVCFANYSLTTVVFPPNLATIGSTAFMDCTALKRMNIPRTVTLIRINAFYRCSALEEVTIEDGFNCSALDLSASTLYSVETIVSWGEALYDRTGLDPYTIVIGATNIAKLSDEQKAIFTNKNWTLA